MYKVNGVEMRQQTSSIIFMKGRKGITYNWNSRSGAMQVHPFHGGISKSHPQASSALVVVGACLKGFLHHDACVAVQVMIRNDWS